jgi:hypothetical protein
MRAALVCAACLPLALDARVANVLIEVLVEVRYQECFDLQ